MIGKKVHNYEIRSHLGEGGMGTVFRAGDSVLDRDVALKMLHAPLLQQPLFLERFKKEARLLAQLLHPNIAVIYNMIEQDNNHFMVMEYVEGKNLEALLQEHRVLSYKVVVPAVIQALEGLRHAHKKGIYHRDIKPSNLILTPEGTVKLMDFGIAMMQGEQRLTQVNRVVGTMEYIAPELIQGKEPSVSTDIYAMGITMYELLTGKLPFEGNTDYNLMQDILKKKPLAVDKMNASVPKALGGIVMKALEKNPSDRFADAKAFQQALVAAFPDLKNAELTGDYIAASVPIAVTTVQPLKKKTPKPTAILPSATKTISRPFAVLDELKRKALSRDNRIVVFSLLAVLLTAIFALVFTAGGNSSKQVSSLQSAPAEKETVPVTKNESGDQLNTGSGGRGADNGNTIVQPNPQPVTPVENKEEKKEEKGKEKEENKNGDKEEKKTDKNKKPVEKKQEEEKKEPVKKEEVAPAPGPVDEKKNDPKPIEKKEAKTIRLATNLQVGLYLRDPLSESSQAGQTLTFVVTSPVRYEGEVIIEKGAIARGSVRSVGKKKISIVLTQVTAASGQTLSLVQDELSGRIEDMISSRNYSATVKKGNTINF